MVVQRSYTVIYVPSSFVETAGIEPASESLTSQTSTYLVCCSAMLLVLQQTKVLRSGLD